MKTLNKYRTSLYSLALLATFAGGGCTQRVEKSEKAIEHEKWIASLDDSITSLQKEISESELLLDEATDRVGVMLNDFDYVNNPREVEGYTILKGWKARYPLTSTGLVARITEGERLELVAALKGGNFTSIAVSCGGTSTVESAVVPYDQALNYRSGGLNTVAFQGAEADSVAAFIADHELDKVQLVFLNGKASGSITLPEANCKMIAETWKLYSSRREVERLEKTLPMLNGRIAALRRMKDNNNPK